MHEEATFALAIYLTINPQSKNPNSINSVDIVFTGPFKTNPVDMKVFDSLTAECQSALEGPTLAGQNSSSPKYP